MSGQPKLVIGGGTWCDDDFDFKACCVGKPGLIIGPCYCTSYGSGILSCLLAGVVFIFAFIVGSIIGFYNWLMCGSCVDHNSKELEFQSEKYRWFLPCGFNCIDGDGINIGKCLLGSIKCNMGICGCLAYGTGFCSCICAALCFPCACLCGSLMGIFNWLTCNSCATVHDYSSSDGLICV